MVLGGVVGCFSYGDLTLAKTLACLRESAAGSAGIVLLLGFANVFGWILTSEGIPQKIADAIFSFATNKIAVILLINLFLLLLGMFMESSAALLILFGPLAALAAKVGMDPIQFAVMMVVNLVIGLTTPPVGVYLFVAQNIAGVSLTQISRAGLPLLLSKLVVLFSIACIPALSLWLPGLMGLK